MATTNASIPYPIEINGLWYNLSQIYYTGVPTNSCTVDTCSLLIANFHYLPSIAGNYFFAILFGILFIINLPLGIWGRTWGVLVGMGFGLAFEVAGSVGRIMAHSDPFDFNPFLINAICVTIGPAFICAAIYLCLARIIVAYGQGNSRFKPRTYSICFMLGDFLALVLQGTGGGIAAVYASDESDTAEMGVHIMVGGLAWQVATMVLFALACGDFVLRLRRGVGPLNPRFAPLRNTFKWKAFLFALSLAFFTVFVRCVYRVAELAQGYNGTIIRFEILYMLLEPTMIAIATILLTVFHPATVFGQSWMEANFRLSGRTIGTDSQIEIVETGKA